MASTATSLNDKFNIELITTVSEVLDRVKPESNQLAFSYSKSMNESEIIQGFNQAANDLFSTLMKIIDTYKLNKSVYNIGGYKNLFNNAIASNRKLPLDKFTLTILVHADGIYSQDEERFLNMDIPETSIKVGNEFGVLSSGIFKEMWKIITTDEKEKLIDVVIQLTVHSHMYFYQRVAQHATKVNK